MRCRPLLSQVEKAEAVQNEKGEAASKRSDLEVLKRIEEMKVRVLETACLHVVLLLFTLRVLRG